MAIRRATVKEIGLTYLDRGASELDESGFNRTRSIIDSLVLDKVVQVRYMHIAFGCISLALALWVIVRIWYDSWRASKLNVKLRPRKWAFLYDLHPAESFPLILGFLIVIQMFSFVAIQASALQTVFVPRCQISAQGVLTQIFVTGIFHLVFGFEMTIRALRKNRFTPRPRFASLICSVIALLLTVAVWLATRLRRPTKKCFGDMIWRSIKSAPLGIVICGILVPSFIIMACIIGFQLYRTVRMDQNERIAGTRMVYYLVLSAVLYIMILPFWVQATTGSFDKNLTSSRVAEFVLFISGAAIAFVHMFLRANAARTAIKPKTTPWHERRKFRLCGPSDLELMNISAPLISSSYRPDEKVADIWARQQAEKEQAMMSQVALPSNTYSTKPNHAKKPSWPLPEGPLAPPKDSLKSPVSPRSANTSKPLPGHKRNQQSYSLFPGSDDIKLPSTVYTPTTQTYSPKPKTPTNATRSASTKAIASKLTSPSVTDISEASLDPPTNPWIPKHRRGSSTDSSATVQIGIRFSAAPAALAASAYRGNSTQAPHRPSLTAVIDSISPPTSQYPLAPAASEELTARLDSPFDPKWDYPQSNSKDARESDSSTYSDFAWLDTTDANTATITSTDTSLNALTRQNSQTQKPPSVKPNRFEIEAITRSASARSRQGYRPPTTPDRPANGFF